MKFMAELLIHMKNLENSSLCEKYDRINQHRIIKFLFDKKKYCWATVIYDDYQKNSSYNWKYCPILEESQTFHFYMKTLPEPHEESH